MLGRRREKHGLRRHAIRAAIGSCCVALALLACGCSQPPSKDTRVADENTIRNLDAQWAKAAASKDVDATVSYYSDDASLLAPNAPVASDKTSIRAAWASLLGADNSLSWEASKVEVARSGDLAYVIGTYELTAKDAQGQPATDRGKFVEVWKKQADGNWKAAVDIFNSDLPAATPQKPIAAKKRAHHRHAKKRAHAGARSSSTE
jgi:ketosteroid isomerase-like protein